MPRYKKVLLWNFDENPQDMKLNISQIPEEIIDQYNLNNNVPSNGWVFMDIQEWISGLKQADRIANDILTLYLDNLGY